MANIGTDEVACGNDLPPSECSVLRYALQVPRVEYPRCGQLHEALGSEFSSSSCTNRIAERIFAIGGSRWDVSNFNTALSSERVIV